MNKRFARKTFRYLAGLALCTGLLSALVMHSAMAATLKPVNVINGDVFTVSDVFDGVEDIKAQKVLGPTPQPGKDLVLNASTLLQVSRALNLGWKPSSMSDKAVLRRAASIVSTDTIRNTVNDKLRAQGVTGKFDLMLDESNARIVLPQGQPETAEITSFKFDPAHDLVEATVAAPSAANPISQILVSGKIQRFAKIPVLKESLTNGTIIGKNDILFIDLPTQNLQPDTIISFDKIDGMTPRRMIEAGKPVRDTDLQRPQVVSRGDQITIVYENGPITLTTKGKAMQGGAKGDLVQIVNLSSNRRFQGMISGDREVTIVE